MKGTSSGTPSPSSHRRAARLRGCPCALGFNGVTGSNPAPCWSKGGHTFRDTKTLTRALLVVMASALRRQVSYYGVTLLCLDFSRMITCRVLSGLQVYVVIKIAHCFSICRFIYSSVFSSGNGCVPSLSNGRTLHRFRRCLPQCPATEGLVRKVHAAASDPAGLAGCSPQI